MNDLEFWGYSLIVIGLLAIIESGVQYYRERIRHARMIRRVLGG
tara:strand:- start:13 stop:144 length:132 start_codon:yes stop_codon:yes gene_type:complete